MKAGNKSRKQSGFFDLGLSLVVMAIAGGSAYAIETTQPGAEAAVEHSQPATALDMVDTGYPPEDVQ